MNDTRVPLRWLKATADIPAGVTWGCRGRRESFHGTNGCRVEGGLPTNCKAGRLHIGRTARQMDGACRRFSDWCPSWVYHREGRSRTFTNTGFIVRT